LYLRRLDQLTALPLAGTDGAVNPFFSPDGRWIAFFADGKLKKVAAGGGATVTLADTPNARGGTWGDDDTLVFMPDMIGGLWRVSSTGGQSVQLTTLAEGEVSHRWPQLLPGSQSVLYTSHNSLTGYEDATLVVQRLPTGARTVLQRGGYYGRYLPSGHLVYMHEGTLFSAPFDLARLERTGEPVPVLQDVAAAALFTGGAQFAAAENGTAVYVPGSNDALPMQWVDVSGTTTFLRTVPASWSDPTFSPDGRHLAMDISDGQQADLWVYEWARDTLTRLTFERRSAFKPVWTPNGRRIAFASARDGLVFNLYWRRVDGTGDVQRLTEGANSQFPASWHPSGKFLAYAELSPQTNSDLMIVPLEGDDVSGWKPGEPTAFVNGPGTEIEPMFSPDGRWLAYFSNESGRFEVYVRPFPGPGGTRQVSNGGGSWPTWSRTRHELLYSTLDQRIMVAPYNIERDSFRVQPPRSWTEGRYKPRGPVFNRSFDLHPDGNRIALAKGNTPTSHEDKVVLVFNFFDELRRAAGR
jgi:serine/threonine-protein kinase